ncbi:ribonuclease G [Scopulibacillus darangshiensis]|uniref:Ribonuclease G n=1 Tax=Scopulibacillus darangshiensis TaxID=442528 RepID=A0A4R2PCW6_9BACL|nr:ribonuclease E/G [Scopulibacillus darangshiensis]TCP32244.1 ribonuclease G [Scopulibacillus darangshiensis]
MNRILFESCGSRARAAFLRDDSPITFYIKNKNKDHAAGNIYIGRVTDVHKGLQGLFVDIGTKKHGFINKSDMVSVPFNNVKQGDFVVVQVEKEAMGSKGPKLTQHVQLRGEDLIYLPYSCYIGVSKKIAGTEKERLRDVMEEACQGSEGVIVRTKAAKQTDVKLKAELQRLRTEWGRLTSGCEEDQLVKALYTEEHFLAEVLNEGQRFGTIDEIILNNGVDLNAMPDISFTKPQPKITQQVKPDLFSMYGIEKDYQSALKRTVYLKLGVSIVIDYTEALTVIDVNTKGFTGDADWETTAFQTNMAAVEEICRQLSLRQIGGIILIDFVNMKDPEHREKVSKKMAASLADDFVTVKLFGFTNLGLFEMTRKKQRYSLQNAVINDLSKPD